jgi:type VI secretion system secreted protein Hcp
MAIDYFLEIDGIKGESPDAKYKDQIQLESWSWGESQSGASAAGGGGGAGKVSMQDFSFAMQVNKASPLLFISCANGKHISKAMLTCRKAGEKQQDYLKIHFEDLLISSYQTGGAAGQEIPIDSISFNFAKIKIEYAPQSAKGALGTPIIHGWDLKQMQKW